MHLTRMIVPVLFLLTGCSRQDPPLPTRPPLDPVVEQRASDLCTDAARWAYDLPREAPLTDAARALRVLWWNQHRDDFATMAQQEIADEHADQARRQVVRAEHELLDDLERLSAEFKRQHPSSEKDFKQWLEERQKP